MVSVLYQDSVTVSTYLYYFLSCSLTSITSKRFETRDTVSSVRSLGFYLSHDWSLGALELVALARWHQTHTNMAPLRDNLQRQITIISVIKFLLTMVSATLQLHVVLFLQLTFQYQALKQQAPEAIQDRNYALHRYRYLRNRYSRKKNAFVKTLDARRIGGSICWVVKLYSYNSSKGRLLRENFKTYF